MVLKNVTSDALGHKAFCIGLVGFEKCLPLVPIHIFPLAHRFLEAVPFLSLLGRCLFRHDWTRANGQCKCDNDDP